MNDDLKALIEKARHYEMTSEERREQRISLAYGNAHFDNPSITRDDIMAAFDRLESLRLSISTTLTLFDDENTRKALEYESKWNLMCDDERNSHADGFGDAVEAILEFGKTYRLTIEEVEHD